MPFEPIAIVGRACVLPGALTPEAFWVAIRDGRDLTGPAPEGLWRLDRRRVLGDASEPAACDRGGYVSGFEQVFDPGRYDLSPDTLDTLDPLFLWLLHVVGEAVREAGLDETAKARTGLVAGNLSYPSQTLNRYAEAVWLEGQGIDFLDGMALEVAGLDLPSPINRFMSGHPAQLAAMAVGLRGEAFCLDAACASSLYALKAACDRLHDRDADVMVAAAVNRADDLFLHVGFTALQALSPSGRSRPFHREADGLLPAEGAAAVTLMRLSDAVQAGKRIFGVIRGIGLSNDGHGRGILVPEAGGEERALRAAYAANGLSPRDVSLIECHATGTAVGDTEEVLAMNRVFAEAGDLPVGSHKSNIGHTITASGMAGLLKVLGAMEAATRPPTLGADDPVPAFADGPLRPLGAAEPWESKGPRRAGISSFGFGGNNAHVIVEEYRPKARLPTRRPAPAPAGPIAIVGLGAAFGDCAGGVEFARRLLGLDAGDADRSAHAVEFPLEGMRFPPADLKKALPQQTMILAAAMEAVAGLDVREDERWGTVVGMGCDPEISRHGLRSRLAEWAEKWQAAGFDTDADWLARAGEGIAAPLDAARVIGTMPNIVANRLNRQFDWKGFGYTVSGEELSGLVAFRAAARALRTHEIDAALIGAVDVCCSPVHAVAMGTLGNEPPGDAAIALVAKRLEDAERDGDAVLAVFGEDGPPADTALEQLVAMGDGSAVTRKFGHVHAASGLLHLAAAVVACAARARVAEAAPWLPSANGRRARILARSFDGREETLALRAHPAGPHRLPAPVAVPHIRVFSGPDRATLREGDGHGPARAAVVAPDADALQERCDALAAGAFDTRGVWLRDAPIGGEVAFVFTGAAAAYAGMGRSLLLAVPELADAVAGRMASAAEAAGWVYADPPPEAVSPFDQLKGCTVLSQVHAELTRGLLGIRPDAVLGLSSGETNGLVALGAWRDPDALFAEISASGMYGTELTGACRAWAPAGGTEWRNWHVLAPLDAVRAAIADEDDVRITIVNAADDVVIGGEAAACMRVVERIGSSRCLPLGHDMVVHCPAMAPFAETWRRIHSRDTRAVPGVRFYANAIGAPYVPDRDAVADMLTRQALETVDFPRTVEAAWRDGVRVFVEHGPRGTLSAAVGRILGEREHVAVALDRAHGTGLEPLFDAVAELFVAGVPMDIDGFRARMDAARGPTKERATARTLRLDVHLEPIRFPSLAASGIQVMEPPPSPPPVGHLSPLAPLEPGDGVTVMAPPPATQEPCVPPSAAPTDIDSARRFLARVAEMHSAFLDEQSAMYRRFLDLMQRTDSLRDASQPSVAPPPVPAPEPAVVFSREDLETLASGRISAVFGELFERQDGYARQVRMPQPPLLLADRVVALEGEPGSMGKGRIATETDVAEGAWYLHHGVMPPGLLIESGQADLLLISWLGVDFLNRGERVYRLLGCELTFHGGLPRPGETLHYDIHVDGHANQGDVRLFFFHYDCRVGDEVRLSVRNGQAGFFTDDELAHSGGVLWNPDDEEPRADARLEIPERVSRERRFDAARIDAFARGDAYGCFGPGFEMAAAHQRTPTIPEGRLRLIDEVTEFDPRGGPWKRGYLRAEARVPADCWFYDGHFKNDPCMPGTLMAEAAVQALSVHMAALGLTIDRDGWRFEPTAGESAKFVCRGQVIPDKEHHLLYEVFVEEVIGGRRPTIRAALLCTADGLKVFFCRRMSLSLVPGWPLSTRPEALPADVVPHAVSPHGDVRGDFAAVLACAWGPPSQAFGSMYAAFDGGRKVPRLPGPPYLCVSRVVSVDCPPARPTAGARLVAEFDVDPDAWYFRDNPARVMPYCVLLEALLQPCGWLGSYMGFAMKGDEDTCFRNLDGDDALVLAEVGPDAGTLRVEVTATRSAEAGDMSLVFYDVESFVGDTPVMRLRTSFGFFKISALRDQAGLAADEAQRAWLTRKSECTFEPDWQRVADGRLCMIDAVTGLWPEEGEAGVGRIRGRQSVDPHAWYFKAHFFQDPVQAGSLGIEALLQLLKCFMMASGLDDGIPNPRFEPAALGVVAKWRYRGQVLPTAREVTTELEITRIEREENAVLAVARGNLWVDGTRIYEVEDLGMRVAAGHPTAAATIDVDLDRMPWLADHCPTHTVPVLPMMAALDLLATAVAERDPDRLVVGIVDAVALRWMVPPMRLTVDARPNGDDRWLVVLSDERGPAMRGTVIVADSYPAAPDPLAPLTGAVPVDDPYASGAIFHGPAFQVASAVHRNGVGSTVVLDAAKAGVRVGHIHPALLDGIFHAIPHDGMDMWFPGAPEDSIGYPQRIERLTLYGPTPDTGQIRGEVRAELRKGNEGTPVLRAQVVVGDRVWTDMTVVEALMPKGPLGRALPLDRQRFLTGKEFVPGVALSSVDGAATVLRVADMRASAWLPGTLEYVYGDATPRGIAVREHVARAAGVHPGRVRVDGDGARTEFEPLTRFPLRIEETGEAVRVAEAGPSALDIAPVRDFWRTRLDCGPWSGEAVVLPLIERFVRRVVVADPDGFAAVAGKPVLFAGNHQTGIESLLFSIVGAALGGRSIVTVAKHEHKATWLGRLLALLEEHPDVDLPRLITYFDRSDPASMLPLLADLKQEIAEKGSSLMIHAEGTRSVHCRRPVERLATVFTELGLTIVPVRFLGGLPIPGEETGERLEFPVGYGRQDILIGAPIPDDELAALPLDQRRQRVLDGMNTLGPDWREETPHAPDPAFAKAVARLVETRHIREPQAVVLHVMGESYLDEPAEEGMDGAWLGRLRDWIRS